MWGKFRRKPATVYALQWNPFCGGDIIGVYAHYEGASEALAGFSSVQQSMMVIKSYDVQ